MINTCIILSGMNYLWAHAYVISAYDNVSLLAIRSKKRQEIIILSCCIAFFIYFCKKTTRSDYKRIQTFQKILRVVMCVYNIEIMIGGTAQK